MQREGLCVFSTTTTLWVSDIINDLALTSEAASRIHGAPLGLVLSIFQLFFHFRQPALHPTCQGSGQPCRIRQVGGRPPRDAGEGMLPMGLGWGSTAKPKGTGSPPAARASPGPETATGTSLGSGCSPSAVPAPTAHARRTFNIGGSDFAATKRSRERRRHFAGSGRGSLFALPSAEN